MPPQVLQRQKSPGKIGLIKHMLAFSMSSLVNKAKQVNYHT